ncbi:hypothetical protein FNH22_07350 [Fulvivirga sp. M361]|uniref:hypothetical protein n=1 Tax=Fulvivirga sp. M361 TaxID=2594266 RepID=UPI00117ABDE9|nr:hypothetical protein [Fulvivirga sp. M361]TRX60850.1 hypothetical protein FNH22_07350 [Fulvivirga sp. M361]
MKQIIAILIMTLAYLTQIQAQDKQTREKIQAARIALITERLGLTPEQAEKFWPLYNEFTQKKKQLNQQYKIEKAKLDMETASEKEKKALLDFGLKLKEQSLGLERSYSDRMLNIISTDQIISLRKAEGDFRQMVLQQIQKRKEQRQNQRLRNNERQRQHRNN